MKFIPYGKQCLDGKDVAEVVSVLKTDWITQGPKIKEFEDALCHYTGSKYAVAVTSGTAALHIAAIAAGISKGDEVITSPITFASSSNSILYACGKPVFADVQADTANIDPKEIEKKINRKTKAIIPVHFSGQSCEMDKISRMAKKHNLIVIEDAAHALGSVYKGSKIGSCKYSDMTILSFHPVKLITTGEGGAVLTNNKKLYEKLLMLRAHGITKDSTLFENADEACGAWYHEMQILGFNYRITDFQCALGISQLKKLNSFVSKRRELVKTYNKELSKIDGLVLPIEKTYGKSAWHIYCVRLRDSKIRKKVFESLRKNNIGVQVHYIPVYWHPYYKKLGYKRGLCPNAEKFYQGEITLPLYPTMTKKEVAFVIKKLKEVLK